MFRGQKKINLKLHCYVQILYGRTDYIFHDGALLDCRPIADAGLLARGNSGNRGRQTFFFTAVVPMPEFKQNSTA